MHKPHHPSLSYSIIKEIQNTQRMSQNFYKAKSGIDGVGLFTGQDYKCGDFIAYIDGPIVVTKNNPRIISPEADNWIGVGRYSWINTNKSLFRFINHSCEPNVAQVSRRKVVAINDIPAGTEIVIDYSLTEAEKGWKIEHCSCKSKSCRKKIGPIFSLEKSVYRKKYIYIPKKFKELYESTHKIVRRV